MLNCKAVWCGLLALLMCCMVQAGPLVAEGFDDISALEGQGWAMLNNSVPVGETGWFQGDSTYFSAVSGEEDSYIAANFLNAGFGGSVSNWLFTPVLTLDNGLYLSYFTRTETVDVPGDSLYVWMSLNGTSTDVADFTLALGQVGSGEYPDVWTRRVATISGLAGPVQGRIAFQYVVDDTSAGGNYIGIDSMTVDLPEPASLGLVLFGMAALVLPRLRAARRR